MSLDRRSVHVRLTPDMHEMLAVLAGLANDDVAAYAGYLLEKTIVGEFHAVTLQADRMRRLGLTRSERDCEGSCGSARARK